MLLHEIDPAEPEPRSPDSPAGPFASSYRPIERQGLTQLDVWQEPMALGRPFPTLPL